MQATTLEKPRKKSFYAKYKKEIQAYSLLAFPLVWWGIFFVYGFFRSFYFSFTDLRINVRNISEITFTNYARIFNVSHPFFDPVFWRSIVVTVIWTVTMMIANNLIGLLLAYTLTRLKRGRRFFLALLFWPTLVSAVVGADLTKMIFSSNQSGFMNQIIGLFGFGPIAWFDHSSTALIGLMITPFLLGFSVKLIIYYAALLSIPDSYTEAARLETNKELKIFRLIKLPLIKNAIILNLILSLIDGFKILGPMQLITEGGPDNSTLSTVLYIYQLGFERSRMGQASAYAFVLFFIILIISIIQLKFSGREAVTHE